MLDKIKSFGKYKTPHGETVNEFSLNSFQKELYRNCEDNSIFVGKARQERVTTSFAHVAYFFAKHKSRKVGIWTPNTRMFKHYKKMISLFEDEHVKKEKIVFGNSGGEITHFTPSKRERCDTIIIDEAGFTESIGREIEKAQKFSSENIIVSVTIRENNDYVDTIFKQEINQLFWALKEFQNFKYIEAREKAPMFTKDDIKKYHSVIKKP